MTNENKITKAPPARLAVLGSPISHSRSPRIHRAAYEALGLDWEYTAIECGETELEARLESLEPEWRGFSVTMPLKVEAHRLSAALDPVAIESGVVNTLFRLLGPAGRTLWAGFNTDVPGLAAALREAKLDARHTVVLGAGATAVSAVLAARRLGAERVTVLARRGDAARALAERFDGSSEPDGPVILLAAGSFEDAPVTEQAASATLVISTLPGTAGADANVPAALLSLPLFDVAYDPWPSPLAERWRSAGGEAHAGLGMLLHQALVQVRIFVGGEPGTPLENEAEVLAAMREAL